MAPQLPHANEDLERFREYLGLLARLQFGSRYQGKVDLSGVVQQTLLEAHREGDRLANQSEEQKAAWLRQALANNLRDEIRKVRAGVRDVARERSLEVDLDESSARLGAWLATDQSSPSEHAMRQEQLLA